MGRIDAELEIGLRWRADVGEADGFDVSLHYDEPEDMRDRRQLGDVPLVIDTDSLGLLEGDEPAYARQLSASLFGHPDVREFYMLARAAAEGREIPLHLRLLIDPKAPARYHALRWESLRDPADESPIATRQNISFSRYLSSSDWRPVSPPAKRELRALVLVANPRDLDQYGSSSTGLPLPPVRVDEEVARAREALVGMDVSVRTAPRATLQDLLDSVTVGPAGKAGVDVLYLVCHGNYSPGDGDHVVGDSVLYLEKPDGTADPVPGSALVEGIRELSHRPTIAVLCACQTAGSGAPDSTADSGALAALGPRLAAAGIPAVLGMQGDVSMETMRTFLPAFFEALREDGVVDRAVAVARSKVKRRPDWWTPVLFSRLRTGRTYYLPEFGTKSGDTWRALVGQLRGQRCTPVIGSGLANSILGSREEIAGRWVERWQAPVAPHNREDLAKVAQYLRVRISALHPANELTDYLMTEMREKFGDVLEKDILKLPDPVPALRAVGKLNRANDTDDPFTVLAELPVPIYFTTSWTGLIEDALEDAGRPPVVRFFDWNNIGDEENDKPFDEPPTVGHPLVYHLFGTLRHPESLVLSEDAYFDWLQTWIAMRTHLPKCLGPALMRRSLLFLGYRLDDWDFRVLFQSIKSFGGSAQLQNNRHVGVQLSRESQLIEPEAAQEYLEDYFGPNNVDIYWGEPRAFLSQLRRRLGERP